MYKVVVDCNNCSFVGDVEIKKGLLIKDALPEKECPNCGCKELSKARRKVKTATIEYPTLPWNPDRFIPGDRITLGSDYFCKV